MPHKASGETYVWDTAKEKNFLEKIDEYLSYSGGKHPSIAILDQWAAQFNSEYGGVPAYGITLYQKKERMKIIYRGLKALQCRTSLRYDPSTDRVICSDDAWQSFIQVYTECNHLRHEGLRNKELYYNVFEKNHVAGSMDNSGTRPIFEKELTPTTDARHCNNRRSGADAGPSRSRGSSGKRKKREETDEMTYMAMQERVSHFRSRSQSCTNNDQSSRPDHMLMCMNIMSEIGHVILKMNEYSSASEHEEDDLSSENEHSDNDSYLAKAVVAVAANYVLADGVDGTGPSTGTQQHASRRGAMNQMRDMMADDMWDRCQSSPWYKST
ncbi:hypothetical protein TIFTF001_002996 [Ficus carica]|uniref:Myb/SANT-like domain-containing protein n=1 Tax=Ficus carica TaxID=3494 RepID=A0AA88CQK1_FICCA|nr:hypothetical protein TIFTF001_002996 [Ficus carica]